MIHKKYILGIVAGLMVASVGVWSTLKARPPEIEALDVRSQSIAKIAANAAAGNQARLKTVLAEALQNGVSVNEIKEVLLQQYAYAGFPRALNAIGTFSKVMKERTAAGIKDKEGKKGQALAKDIDRNAYGAKVQAELTGAPMQVYMDFIPAIDTFLKEHLFADIFGRGVLSYQDRETATIATLSVIPGVEPQLRSHIRGGMNVGLTPAQVRDILTITGSDKEKEILKQVLDEQQTIQQEKSRDEIRVLKSDSIQFSRAAAENFSGMAEVGGLLPRENSLNISTGLVRFEAGARTAWHTHPAGQLLIIADGIGRVQQEGGEIIKVYPGDVVWFPAGVRHWHGADVNNAMSHYAFAGIKNGKSSDWLEKVRD